jgi:hypothetical protein
MKDRLTSLLNLMLNESFKQVEAKATRIKDIQQGNGHLINFCTWTGVTKRDCKRHIIDQ